MAPSSPDQSRDQGTEQGSASAPGVVHEPEEAEIQRQLLLRDAPVRAEPGAQQGPGPLHGVDVHLAEAVLVARVLAACVADRHVPLVELALGLAELAVGLMHTPSTSPWMCAGARWSSTGSAAPLRCSARCA